MGEAGARTCGSMPINLSPARIRELSSSNLLGASVTATDPPSTCLMSGSRSLNSAQDSPTSTGMNGFPASWLLTTSSLTSLGFSTRLGERTSTVTRDASIALAVCRRWLGPGWLSRV